MTEEVHANKNCINLDSTTMSNVPSENEVMSNGSHRAPKSTTFRDQDTFSISESVIVQNNQNKKDNSKQAHKNTTLENFHLHIALIMIMCIIAMILQIPTVLYYTDPPSAEGSMILDNINVESCSVS